MWNFLIWADVDETVIVLVELVTCDSMLHVIASS